ncbi:MAG: hypothetical protein H6610_07970 [Ignavibacteriales bacterium]|nr:hypothetical protein [Ignavibacteriales bacterium]MCB9209908.1 hypothetical protein [Ignavibacteriales bacterium]MCB9219377.1 hypothetical protein [Ignavibacteriales bacterium]MCB9260264.1 hypothetical protein [Ignavibacteriales bacterium]
MELSNTELNIINDKEFLLKKIVVIKKIQKLFEILQRDLKGIVDSSEFIFHENVDVKYGKIFKGEDYKNLPYVVLDYPKLYSKENIFTFRTMFWWGNFYSSTFHLQGEIFNELKSKTIKNLQTSSFSNLYICVNKTPWEYHYNDSNYILLTSENISKIDQLPFLKLSKKFDLDNYQILNEKAKLFLDFVLNTLLK